MVDSLDPYAAIAEFYDLEHDLFEDDIDMYLHFAEGSDGPVLELACGTGRIAVALANAGHTVVGADISPAMLDRARLRPRSHDASLTFVEADMRGPSLISGGPFGLVILGLGALSHLTSSTDQIATLRSARESLAADGLLLIDVMHPSPARLYALDESMGLDGWWTTASGETVERFSSHRVHPADQLIESRIWSDRTAAGGNLSRHAASITQRYLSPGELELMLQSAGFDQVTFFGSYGLDPFEDDSDRLIAAVRASQPT